MKFATLCALFALAACGGDDSNSGTDAAPHPDVPGAEAIPDAGCPRTAVTGDHARFVVISHPFAQNGNVGNTWEVLGLAVDGTLSRLNLPFTMKTKAEGEIVFTPDGKLGFAAQDDGTIGEFFLDTDGTPTVIEGGFAGSHLWYADKLVMSADGQTLYIIDQQTTDNGGGIYALRIGCDNLPHDMGLVYSVASPGGLVFTGGHALLAASADTEILDTSAVPWTKSSGTNPFPDTMTIVGGTALTADGSTYLVGDDNQFETGGEGMNRLAVVGVGASALTPVTVLDIDDPITLLPAPSGHTVLSVSGFGNAVFKLSDASGAWTVGDVVYTGTAPQLPSGGVITSDGLALIAELSGVRPFQIDGDGTVTDKGLFLIGDGSGDDLADIVGAIGAQP